MKRIYLFLLLLLCNQFLLAQSYIPPPFADIDNNYRNHANNVFGALEANRVPTGFLVDYGFDFTEPKIYNGQVLVDSTLMEQGLYSELYKTIFTSRFNNNTGQLRHPSIHDSLCYIARSKEVITLSGLFFKFNAIDPNAQANGKMQTINGQLRDVYVNGVWQNPYQEFTTVAISPSIISYKLTYCSVVMPSNLFLSNMLSQISNIQFDANDGQGYRNILFDVPLTLNYADTGWKHWVFKVNLTNGQQLYSHSKVHFNNTSNIAGSGGGIAARGIADRRRTISLMALRAIPNLVVAAIGGDGKVSIFNGTAGSTDVIADVVGYYSASEPGALFSAVTPARVLDSRFGTGGYSSPWPADGTRDVAVTGLAGVPANATAVVLNLTVTNPTSGGYLTVYPAGVTRLTASNLNFGPGQTIPNLVVAFTGPGAMISIYNATGSTDVIADVVGYYR